MLARLRRNLTTLSLITALVGIVPATNAEIVSAGGRTWDLTMTAIPLPPPLAVGSTVTQLSDGTVLVAWQQGLRPVPAQPGNGAFGRLHTTSGAPLGDSFSLSPDPRAAWMGAAGLPGGGFVALWFSDDVVCPATCISLRRFDADAQPIGDVVVVGTGGSNGAALATAPDGRLLVVWRDPGTAIQGQLFDASGAPDGPILALASSTTLALPTLDVDWAQDGASFAMVWSTGEGNASDMNVRRFAEDGSPIGATQTLTSPYSSWSNDRGGAVTHGANRILVAWKTASTLYAQMHDLDGAPLGTSFQVTGEIGIGPSVVASPGDVFTVSWGGPDWDPTMSARLFDASGIALGPAFPVAPAGAYSQPSRAIHAAGDDLLFAWSGGISFFDRRFRCENGLDDDGDSFIDHPADPGCFSASSDNEAPKCNDGLDNDGDLLVDLADAGCQNKPFRNNEAASCGLGAELALLLAVFGVRKARVR